VIIVVERSLNDRKLALFGLRVNADRTEALAIKGQRQA